MKNKALQWMTSLVLLVLADAVWLGFIAKSFYADQLGPLLRMQLLMIPGVTVWVLISLGIVAFALPRTTSASHALLKGALLGFVLYGVYDLTNLSLVQGWPVVVTVLDIAWGTMLCAINASLTYVVAEKMEWTE